MFTNISRLLLFVFLTQQCVALASNGASQPPNWHSYICHWYFGLDSIPAIDPVVKSVAEQFLAKSGDATEVVTCWSMHPDDLMNSKLEFMDGTQRPLLILLMNERYRNTLTPTALRGVIGHEVAHWRMVVKDGCELWRKLSLRDSTICEHDVDVKALDYLTVTEGLQWLKETLDYALQWYRGYSRRFHEQMFSVRIVLMEDAIERHHKRAQ